MKKTLKLCGLTACCAVMLSSYTCAYIDPSVMTYTIQAIAGVVIAVGAVAGIYWRKAKKKVNEKLGPTISSSTTMALPTLTASSSPWALSAM